MRFTRLLLDVGKKYSNARVLLGIETGATKKEIHSAYLKMAKEYHPDRAQTADSAETEAKFQEIGEAYQFLIGKSDPNLDFSESEPTQEEAIKNGHALNDEGFPLVADIAYAKNVLGVEPDATKEEVESRFVELSLKYHPDIGDEEIRDAEYFRTITESYKTFMNQEILNPGQVTYSDAIHADQWYSDGRRKVHKVENMSKRRHEQFFGFAPDEIKPAAVLKKMRSYAADAGRPFAVRSATYQGMLPRSDDSRGKK